MDKVLSMLTNKPLNLEEKHFYDIRRLRQVDSSISKMLLISVMTRLCSRSEYTNMPTWCN